MKYRNLTRSEIKLLELQHCHCENWQDVLVTENFVADRIRDVQFAGSVKLGCLTGTIEVAEGIFKPCGIDHAYIHNCTIADNVRISHVNNLSHYQVEDDVVIENVSELAVTGITHFGNGTQLDILNEGGGRTLTIFDRLNAQIAYLQVCYRHDHQLQERLQSLIASEVAAKRSSIGTVKKGARIFDCNLIRNIMIGEYVTLTGAFALEDGTILGAKDAPTLVGAGVVAKHFIILESSQVDGGVILDKCFVGQGVRLGKQFSAENSAFFANCEGFHGEAVSLFAGPYTVSHHKSTLLIAAMTSFFNAGSGTNQSNHMYKIGPVHQGILERGVKTGSFSYMLWPGRVGAFSVVIGKHYSNFDISDLPFSYIFESEGKSILYAGKNLFTGGTRRDTLKWASRDRRKVDDKLDLIHFDFRGPYIIGKILRAIDLLKKLEMETPPEQALVHYKGVFLKRNQLQNFIANYEMAIKICLGFAVVNRLEASLASGSDLNWQEIVTIDSDTDPHWLDISGMYVPQKQLQSVLDGIKKEQIGSITAVRQTLSNLYEQYPLLSWQYILNLIKNRLQVEKINAEHLRQIITQWRDETIKLDQAILKDLYKDFDLDSRISYGIDGDESIRDADFYAVRGAYEENKVVRELEQEIVDIRQRAERLLALL